MYVHKHINKGITPQIIRIIVLSPGPGLSYSQRFSEDLLRFDCDWTGHGPGPVIAIYVFRHFSAETWHAVLNIASSLYKCPKHNLVKQ